MASTRTSKTAGETASTVPGADAPDETTAAPEEGPAPTGKRTIKFTGPTVTTRRLTKKDFADAGVEGFQDVEWSAANDHTVDASDWPEEAVTLVKSQPNFRVSEK